MNTELKHYIRTSFPEYSDLTTLEIFIMKHLDRNFMSALQQTYYTSHVINPTIIKDLIIIDLSDYFIRHKEKYAFDFLIILSDIKKNMLLIFCPRTVSYLNFISVISV